ncbi:SagB/ThcOx family dehydrogenase [Sorangium sp. So ce131]|uniref:SagB/ThcOx family dehydrogenase n=1 Tax=Sorangium sp. So ce131 TaxID=3133282 RepID=UPI003F5DE5A2
MGEQDGRGERDGPGERGERGEGGQGSRGPCVVQVLSFRSGVAVAERPDGVLVIRRAEEPAVEIERATPGLRAVVEALAGEGDTERRLLERAARDDGGAGLMEVAHQLARLAHRGLLAYTVAREGRRLATLAGAAPEAPAAGARHVMSRFAWIRSDGGAWVLESPFGRGRVEIHDAEAAAVCHALAEPRTAEEVLGAARGTSGACATSIEVVRAIVGLLLGCGALDGGGRGSGEALAGWSFHDLAFHTRSRQGRHDAPYGATCPHRETLAPLPGIKPRMPGEVVPLYRPDLEALAATDVPFTRVLEQRRSIREHGERPIRAEQLGELLYRAARIHRIEERGPGRAYEQTRRPYPSGGACHALELYPVVRTCDGLGSGLYHYRADEHALSALSGLTREAVALLEGARRAMGASAPPEVLIVVAARFPRVSWAYESIAYATLLKDVGGLYQTLYLVASAMDLAVCAVGGGDSDLFARAAGLEYLAETSVGEIAVGSRAEDQARG